MRMRRWGWKGTITKMKKTKIDIPHVNDVISRWPHRSDNFTVKRTGALTIKKQPLSA